MKIVYTCRGLENLRDYKKLSRAEADSTNSVENERRILLCTYLDLGMYKQAKELFIELLESSDNSEAAEKQLLRLICENASKVGVKMDAEQYFRRLREGVETQSDVFESICRYFKTARSEDKMITKIKEYVQANYAADISLETVAENCVFIQIL